MYSGLARLALKRQLQRPDAAQALIFPPQPAFFLLFLFARADLLETILKLLRAALGHFLRPALPQEHLISSCLVAASSQTACMAPNRAVCESKLLED